MDSFSKSPSFSNHQSSSCFNFCDGVFQNANVVFFGGPACVTGCRLSDLTSATAKNRRLGEFSSITPVALGSANVLWNDPPTTTAFGQVGTPGLASTNVRWNYHNPIQNAEAVHGSTPVLANTASTAVDTNDVRWYLPSAPIGGGQQVASTQVAYPGAKAPGPAPAQIFVPPAQAQTGATVTTVSSTGPNSFAAQQPGRGTITAANISGTRGTVNAVVSGAGAIPLAQSSNIASAQITRSSSYGGKMGSRRRSLSRSNIQSYDNLASAAVSLSVTVAASSAIALIWNVM